MDEDLEVQKKRVSLIDRLTTVISGEKFQLVKKKRSIRERLNRPLPHINEKYDGWGDNTEED
jgi:hypothetical protein